MTTEIVTLDTTTGEVTIPVPQLDASATVAHATEIAAILAPALKAQKLTTNIQGKEYVMVEGWTLLAQMMGHTVGTSGTEPVTMGDDTGFVSHAIVHDQHGNVVGSADGYCMRSEGSWRSRPAYALAAMAQTRATSRALRQRFGYVVRLAGYEATPSEEMPLAHEATINNDQVEALREAAKQSGLSKTQAVAVLKLAAGVESPTTVPASKYDDALEALSTAQAA